MKVLVTGGGGYLGAVLVPKLLVRGHQVKVLDIGYFGLEHLRGLRPAVDIVREDLRQVCASPQLSQALLGDCDVVVHLAAISNDPSAELNPALTEEINLGATKALAAACKQRGVRFIFSSSCSIYGEAGGEVDETGTMNPLTVYARTKVDSENYLLEQADSAWRPAILRNGTLYGFSPRMRFDLVINIFSYCSTLYNEIKVFGEGTQWRPFLHVKDCARAFVHFVENASHRHLVYNIARENLRVIDLAAIFHGINPACRTTHVQMANPDNRDYRVSVRRMKEEGIEPRVGIVDGAEEIIESIVSGAIADPEAVFYRNAKWLKEISDLGQRDHRDILTFLEASTRSRTPAKL